MRYTTIIDLREFPKVYANLNCRLVFLHLTLAADYHAEKRDLANCSLRQLAQETGCSLSAVRHAIRMLHNEGLLTRGEGGLMVKKFVMSQEIPKRPRNGKQAAAAQAAAEAERQNAERDRAREERRMHQERLAAAKKTQFMEVYEQWMKNAREGSAMAKARCKDMRERYEQDCKEMGVTPQQFEL